MLFGKGVLGFAKQLLNSPENDHTDIVWQKCFDLPNNMLVNSNPDRINDVWYRLLKISIVFIHICIINYKKVVIVVVFNKS
jgi:hypothetical protein